jgi:hypothetical protein
MLGTPMAAMMSITLTVISSSSIVKPCCAALPGLNEHALEVICVFPMQGSGFP